MDCFGEKGEERRMSSKIHKYYDRRFIRNTEDLVSFLEDVKSNLSNEVIYPRIVRIDMASFDNVCSECGKVFTDPREASDYCGHTYCHKCRRFEELIDSGDFP